MSIETQIASLTQATNSLLAAVNVRKSTIDSSIDAATQRAVSAAQMASATIGSFSSSAATVIPKGVKNVTGLVGGSTGTDGVFGLVFTGGSGGFGAAGTFEVASGVVTSVSITQTGYGYASAPSVSFSASAGLIGASATVAIGDIIPNGQFYWSLSDDGAALTLYQNISGTATLVSPEVSIPSKAVVDGIPALISSYVDKITGLGIVPMYNRSGWLGARINQSTGRIYEGTRADGSYWQSGVSRMSLDPIIAATLPYPIRPRSGWFTAMINDSGRVLSGSRVDGTAFQNGALSSVSEQNLSQSLHGRIFKDRSVVSNVMPDGVQSIEQGFGVSTSRSGTSWERISPMPTPYIRGVAGVPLQFRKRLPVNMPGTNYKGVWNNSAVDSIRKVGTASNTTDYGYIHVPNSGLPNPSGYADGDYLTVYPIGGGTLTTSLGVVYPGDLIVRKNAQWVVQIAPAGTSAVGTVYAGDWWSVNERCIFDGVQYNTGDRVVMFGGVYYHKYYRGNPENGEMFYRGETSITDTTADPKAGDCWCVSANGTIQSIPVSVNDWLLYDGNSFYSVPSTTVTTVSSGKSYLIPTDGNAANLEVRRVDKTQSYPVRFSAPLQLQSRIETKSVYAFGDSMMHFLRNYMMSVITDRSIVCEGFDSAGASEIASIFEHYARTGNRFSGNVIVSWTGQNNEDFWEETIGSHLRQSNLCAKNDHYYLPVTPAGRREFTFNGTRLVGRWQEAMKNKDYSNSLYRAQYEVEKAFSGRYIDARQVAIDAVAANSLAFSKPDLQFPGMSEVQSAAAYGVIPVSAYTNWPMDASIAAFKGYWTDTTNLPTGGSDNDYYIRSVSGSGKYIGDIIARVGGVWSSHGLGNRNSVVHFGGPNAAIVNNAIARAIKNTIIGYGW